MSGLVTVYNAANGLDASLLRDRLAAERIDAVVLGEHLQGGSGELPAFGLVDVAVAAGNAAQAREVVAAFEREQAMDSGPAYVVVPAEPAHLDALPDVERAAAVLFSPEDLPPALRTSTTPLPVLATACATDRLFVALHCAAERETPVGFALVTAVDGLPHIAEMDVHPDHARQGLGTGLVQAVLDRATASGAAAVTLTTYRHLPWNAPFYARLGFRELPAAELTPGLQAELAAEAAAGLDGAQRIAMRRALP